MLQRRVITYLLQSPRLDVCSVWPSDWGGERVSGDSQEFVVFRAEAAGTSLPARACIAPIHHTLTCVELMRNSVCVCACLELHVAFPEHGKQKKNKKKSTRQLQKDGKHTVVVRR